MKKLVTIIQPFDLKQKVFAYEDGNKIKAVEIETSVFPEEICKLTKSLDINEINLGGAKQYSRKIGNEILKIAKAEYALEDLEIKYL